MIDILRVAIVGAGPAGAYAADALQKAHSGPLQIDFIEKMPAPFGLIRYGVAPDHPRIKAIVDTLTKLLSSPSVRFFGNVELGCDIQLDDIRGVYDAVILATGASRDRSLTIPGCDLIGNYGAADFVGWYDGNPDSPRSWPLDTPDVAVIGAGNVALDITRILAKSAAELASTEIPGNVEHGLEHSQVQRVHLFSRRGHLDTKFSPLEARELGESENFSVSVTGIDSGDGRSAPTRQAQQVADVMSSYLEHPQPTAPRQVILHFHQRPVRIDGVDGRVNAIVTERTRVDEHGNVVDTGDLTTTPVNAVYRAVGYRSEAVAAVPFDNSRYIVPNQAGRVVGVDGVHLSGLYVTGWIKRGPTGLIGQTRADARETVTNLLDDIAHDAKAVPAAGDLVSVLQRASIDYTTWDGWTALDAHERSLGQKRRRGRTKVVDRDAMVAISTTGSSDK